jgi:pimeloyl-ACP methyl ester carboxylesterase
VHLVGHSFGGLTALAVAIRNKVPLLSLSILEAPAPEILRHMGEHRHYGAFREMSDCYFRAFHAGEKAAIEQMIDFYGGAGTFAGWPQRVRDYAVETTPVNILDWRTAYDFLPTSAALAAIDVPTLVLWGLKSHPAIQRANELLARLTTAKIAMISQAAHFMISTHAKETAHVLAQHVIAHNARRPALARGVATPAY